MITRPVRERSHHRHRRDGRERPGRDRLRGGRPARLCSADHSEIADVTKGLADRYEGTQTRPVAAVHPRRRVQHRPGQRAHPQRPPLRPDVRARGRQRADPQGHQQDGHRGRPHPHRHRGLRRRLAAGEALLHVRPADRDRRGRAADRRPGEEGHRDRPRGHRARATSAARSRSAASCPSRTRRSSGPAQLGHEATDARLAKLRDAIRVRPAATPRRSASATTTASPASSKDCCRRGDRRVGKVIEAVWRGRRPVRRLERALLLRPLDGSRRARRSPDEPVDVDWYTTREREQSEVLPVGPPRLRARQGLALGGLAGRPTEAEVDDCRWTPCFDCGVCPQMGTEIQVGPTGETLLPLRRSRRRCSPRPWSTPRPRTSPLPETYGRRCPASARRPVVPGHGRRPGQGAASTRVREPLRHDLAADCSELRACGRRLRLDDARWRLRRTSRPSPGPGPARDPRPLRLVRGPARRPAGRARPTDRADRAGDPRARWHRSRPRPALWRRRRALPPVVHAPPAGRTAMRGSMLAVLDGRPARAPEAQATTRWGSRAWSRLRLGEDGPYEADCLPRRRRCGGRPCWHFAAPLRRPRAGAGRRGSTTADTLPRCRRVPGPRSTGSRSSATRYDGAASPHPSRWRQRRRVARRTGGARPWPRTPDGPPPPPAVQRLRVHYAKRGRLRFSSHRDFQRAFERALRRAAVPMAYSAGFSPHPKVSYAGAAPTGTASEAEYLEIALAQRCDPERLRAALDAALPPGLDVLEVVEAGDDARGEPGRPAARPRSGRSSSPASPAQTAAARRGGLPGRGRGRGRAA